MGNKMLIDAAHPEETRVVVQRGERVEEFDFESAARKQLRGNIYLAKITRVESSLQAAFVDYGGNRHGFLAFNEIHPDYYQIPVADRRALLEEEARLSRASNRNGDAGEDHCDDADENGAPNLDDDHADDHEEGVRALALDAVLPPEIAEDFAEAVARGEDAADEIPLEVHASKRKRLTERLEALTRSALDEDEEPADPRAGGDEHDSPHDLSQDMPDDPNGTEREIANDENVEAVGSGDVLEEVPQRHPRRRKRQYKIQEVIRRRQILLVQVVKEERGNKGAALTTYLSLAGRYTVLMPNTASGGGISRKIASPADRKRLRQIVDELDVPEGMGLIVRTAGAARTKAEIKRDFEYLLRLWENVRDLTLQSTAPALVYEEGNLIKRSIRDLYNKEIEEVLVAGDAAYREAKDFMRMIMPSHAKNVKPYKEPEPIFIRNNVERQLDAMYSPFVTLKSGGYIVINQTEALVAIDVNSGKSTKQHSIEDTALRTNMEAAEEIARQLRLRDLAGLIVIDFIDMEERRNNRSVERKLKDSLRNDRARIQIGRISAFGLLEMSRQRIRTGVLEGSTSMCPHCQGTGMIRSTESVALSVLRALEDYLRSNKVIDLNAVTSGEVALYILNNKRDYLNDIERRFDVRLGVLTDDRMQGSSFAIERMAPDPSAESQSNVVMQMEWGAFETPGGGKVQGDDEARRRARRKRRRGRNGREDSEFHDPASEDGDAEAYARQAEDAEAGDAERSGESEEDQRARKSRRRGRRGGRRQRARREGVDDSAQASNGRAHGEVFEMPSQGVPPAAGESNGGRADTRPYPQDAGSQQTQPAPMLEAQDAAPVRADATGDEAKPRAARRRKRAVPERSDETPVADQPAVGAEPSATPRAAQDERATQDAADRDVTDRGQARETAPAAAAVERDRSEPPPAPRRGWWQRR